MFEPIVYPTLAAELCVSGVYVRVFNEQVDFNLRDPARFMDGLVGHMKNLYVLRIARIACLSDQVNRTWRTTCSVLSIFVAQFDS